MKTTSLLLLSALLLSMAALAYPPPTLTKPSSQTFKVPQGPFPKINFCVMQNGKPRPFGCEFRFSKVEFVGKDGSVLATVKPVKGQVPPSLLPFTKAKKSPSPGQAGLITYTVRAYAYRLTKPSFPPSKGYHVRSCVVTACLTSNQLATALSNVVMPAAGGAKVVLTFDLSWVYSADGGPMVGPHEIYIQNDVTSAEMSGLKLPTINLRDLSEAWIDINPVIIGDPAKNK